MSLNTILNKLAELQQRCEKLEQRVEELEKQAHPMCEKKVMSGRRN